ncbi:MAG: ABC transporter ATP-binding protein [Planctomycetes bacterium]|nr:ABC transporter ATP-binding protein [Planctomycetota bacterium]
MRDPNTLSKPMIRFSNVRFQYADQTFGLTIPDLELNQGERVAIVGPSGSGKTTLVYLATGVLRPESGSITVKGSAISSADESTRRQFRIQNIGFVFQEFALLEYLTVRDNILLAYRIGAKATDTEGARANELAESVGLKARLDRYPRHLSFGERQRVAICRAMATSPPIIVADEPTGNLDAARSADVVRILSDHVKASNATLVMVTHDATVIGGFDRTIDVTQFAATAGA